MAIPTIARVGRFLRAVFAPVTTIFCFSCLLTFIFILYQPHPGPGAIQRLGWQSWDIISDTQSASTSTAAGDGSEDLEIPPGNDSEVDWWNITGSGEDTTFDPASLPLDVWDPLMPHDTGCESSETFAVLCSIYLDG